MYPARCTEGDPFRWLVEELALLLSCTCARSKPSTTADASSSGLVCCPSGLVCMGLASVKESGATKSDKRRCM